MAFDPKFPPYLPSLPRLAAFLTGAGLVVLGFGPPYGWPEVPHIWVMLLPIVGIPVGAPLFLLSLFCHKREDAALLGRTIFTASAWFVPVYLFFLVVGIAPEKATTEGILLPLVVTQMFTFVIPGILRAFGIRVPEFMLAKPKLEPILK